MSYNNNRDRIPKPEIRNFDILKISDMTNRIQTNVSLGGSYWYWNNLNKSEFKLKINAISLGMDKYGLFYKALTGELKYDFINSDLVISGGYKLKLYGILYGKMQLKAKIYPYLDLGASFALGLEFSLFNLIRIYYYNEFTGFVINTANLTGLYFNHYFGMGVYF